MCMNKVSGDTRQEAHRDIHAVYICMEWTNNCTTNLVEYGTGKQNYIQDFGTKACQDPRGACWVHD